MHAFRGWVAAVVLAMAITPLNVRGQTLEENPDDFVKDVVLKLFGANWNLGVSAGNNNHGRFLLQRATLTSGATGERTLRGQDGYSVGFLAGVDLFLRMGMRFGYAYGNSDLVFRTDIGDGSEIFDVDDLGEIENHTISVEIIRYLLPSTASITPYASAGFIGTWYILEDGSAFATNGETTHFRTGALANLGLKVELSDRFDLRLEGATASVRNPFTGRDSYRIPDGITVDEPTRVNRSNLRVAAVYNFGRPKPHLPTARRAGRAGKR